MNISTATLSPLNIFSNWYSFHIFYPILAYFLPVGILLAVINNLLVLLIFISRKNVNRHIKPSIRVYYIATAIGDIIVCFPVLLFYFLGKLQHFIFTVYNSRGTVLNCTYLKVFKTFDRNR